MRLGKAANQWRVYRALIDVGFSVTDFTIINVLGDDLQRTPEGQAILDAWSELSIYYGISAISEAVIRNSLNKLKRNVDVMVARGNLLDQNGATLRSLTSDEKGKLVKLYEDFELKTGFKAVGGADAGFDGISRELRDYLDDLPPTTANRFWDELYDTDLWRDFMRDADNQVDLYIAWNILDDVKSTLSRNIQAIEKIDFLKSKGLTDVQLKNLGSLNDIKALEIAENFTLKTIVLNDKLDDLITNTFSANSRSELATWGSQYGFNTDLISQLEKLSLSNRLDQPEGMLVFFNSQLTKRFENPGYVGQLNEAIRQINAGSIVRIEGGADIIDLSNSKAYQYKAFASPTLDKFKSNLQSASKQFTTEEVVTSYDKIAKLKVLNSSNPTYLMSSDELLYVLQRYLDDNALNATGDNLRALTEIQVENGNGLYRYKIETTLVIKLN